MLGFLHIRESNIVIPAKGVIGSNSAQTLLKRAVLNPNLRRDHVIDVHAQVVAHRAHRHVVKRRVADGHACMSQLCPFTVRLPESDKVVAHARKVTREVVGAGAEISYTEQRAHGSDVLDKVEEGKIESKIVHIEVGNDCLGLGCRITTRR